MRPAIAVLLAAATLQVKQGGVPVGPPRPAINFVGAQCQDDPGNGASTCTIPAISGASAAVPPSATAVQFEVPATWVQALPAAAICEAEGQTLASAQIVARTPGVSLTVVVWSQYPLLDSTLVVDCLGASQ